MTSALYINCRNVIYTSCRRFNVSAYSKNNTRCFTKFKEFQLNSVSPSRISTIHRCLSTRPNEDGIDKPAYTPLMEYPEVIWPGFFRMVKCWLTFKLLMPSLDKDFDSVQFLNGSQQAVHFVSDALSREDYESLDGLVTPEAIEILKLNISKMSDEQKREIKLHKNEFFFCFPWDVNIRSGTDGSSKIVEVMMVFHLLRDWKDPEAPSKVMEASTGNVRLDLLQGIVSSSDYVTHAIVGNYRFIREFGTRDKLWLMNVVNQFKLSDLQE